MYKSQLEHRYALKMTYVCFLLTRIESGPSNKYFFTINFLCILNNRDVTWILVAYERKLRL